MAYLIKISRLQTSLIPVVFKLCIGNKNWADVGDMVDQGIVNLKGIPTPITLHCKSSFYFFYRAVLKF